jgi:Cu(I)/Ag(I) efflux system periplasmic protein CusF
MNLIKTLAAAAVALASLAPVAHATTHGETVTAQQQTPTTEGEIRRVDREAKKLTIRHGPIQNLDMPAMTMVFQVNDPAVLDRVKPGEKVRFTAEKIGGAYTVTRLEPVQ